MPDFGLLAPGSNLDPKQIASCLLSFPGISQILFEDTSTYSHNRFAGSLRADGEYTTDGRRSPEASVDGSTPALESRKNHQGYDPKPIKR